MTDAQRYLRAYDEQLRTTIARWVAQTVDHYRQRGDITRVE